MKIGAGKHDITQYNRSNAMTPLNWMCGISQTILLPIATYNYSNWLGIASFIVFISILIFYGYIYNYFATRDPNRLQSEEYNLESQRIAFAYDEVKGIAVKDSSSYITIASPQHNEESNNS